jgi:hypothetical protein
MGAIVSAEKNLLMSRRIGPGVSVGPSHLMIASNETVGASLPAFVGATSV